MISNQKKNVGQPDEVVEYILTREGKELELLSVQRIAREFAVSRYRLSRSFKKSKKVNLEAFIFRIKITQAAFLLQTSPELTVKDAAERIGYYSYGYFIRVFRRYFGTTPGRYRELKRRGTRAYGKIVHPE